MGNIIYWIFDLVDPNTKKERTRCLLNDHTKDKLLPIIKEYMNSNNDDDDLVLEAKDNDNRLNQEEYTAKTRIFQLNSIYIKFPTSKQRNIYSKELT